MAVEIPLYKLLYLGIPLGAIWVLSYRWGGPKYEIGLATGRMISQLLLIGYALVFLFENESIWLGIGVLVVMSVAASVISIRPFKEQGKSVYLVALGAIIFSSIVHLVLILYGVLGGTQLYEARVMIPIAGMLYSSAMNTVSQAGERYFHERAEGKGHESARNSAFKAGLIPKINTFLAVGLVSLPGMMTGQILSGTSPLIAVRYQIMVMLMLFGSGGLSSALFLHLIGRLKLRI